MNPAFRFARGGKVYKELESDQAHEIAGYIRTGIISANDDYWMPGMGDWKKVYSRQWDFPKPADDNPAPKLNLNKASAPPAFAPTPTPASSGAATMQSFVKAATAYIYECATCEKGFNDPAKAVSGYSVIGKAAMFSLIGIFLMVLVYAMRGVLVDRMFDFDQRNSNGLLYFITGLVTIVALGLFLMSLFELIASAVTHGIYRANPERCPHCKSHTFTRKG
jgi:hypothetical protein